MTDRPIIFSAPMIQALLAGRKTQTRRILKPQPPADARYIGVHYASYEPSSWFFQANHGGHKVRQRFEEGDRLWVRENCQAHEQASGQDGVHFPADSAWEPIQAGSREAADDWLALYHYGRRRGAAVPSIHMPRWASRLTLLVTEVRVERLQDISRDDAMAEGIVQTWGDFGGNPPAWALREGEDESHFYDNRTSVENFRLLWESIHGADAWDANPWLVAVSFNVLRKNIDLIEVTR